MTSLQRVQVLRKLIDELRDNQSNPILNIGYNIGLTNHDNPFQWRVTLFGPRDTPYNGGIFFLTLIFSDDYPSRPPEVKFDTPIYHINVRSITNANESLGEPNLNILNQWKPEFKVKDIIISIYSLFYMNNINCVFSWDMAEEFRNNKSLYEEKIKYFTNKYANPMICNREYNNWDFTYNN